MECSSNDCFILRGFVGIDGTSQYGVEEVVL